MSSRLGGNHCLAEDPGLESGLEGGGGHELDAAAKAVTKLPL